ncbi:PREDICTED: uncharacterized protein LOC109338890 [Lupinus angustifolius]|uniref:uncharacterized protein LOC109338890 n=1 Tax=Lupinus angustifolius TaxID=3871 RepID=UPI00092F263E|nr:PREDICTED: uncharacterized protein LOC109338890 [Lupinus angustifolius]
MDLSTEEKSEVFDKFLRFKAHVERVSELKLKQLRSNGGVVTPVEVGNVLCQEEEEQPLNKTLFFQMVGSLRYICNSRPDIAYGVGLISRFMENPKQSHLLAVKKVLRYLKGTIGYEILYPTNLDSSRSTLTGFSDFDWCGDKSDRKAQQSIYST